MTTTNKVRSMRIGCDNLVWFPLITDDGTTLTYGEPVPLPGLMKVGISTNSDMSLQNLSGIYNSSGA